MAEIIGCFIVKALGRTPKNSYKELRKQMGQKGKDLSKAYCKENVTKQWNDFISKM